MGTGEKMEIPGVAECMVCHGSMPPASPATRKLAQLAEANQLISWTRLYRLPDFVFFSHRKHAAAKVDCAVCHGPVKERQILWQEKEISMVACVDCHRLRKAPLSCDLCHNIGH
jgi:Zn ribbon nucleic-acid-binding protein